MGVVERRVDLAGVEAEEPCPKPVVVAVFHDAQVRRRRDHEPDPIRATHRSQARLRPFGDVARVTQQGKTLGPRRELAEESVELLAETVEDVAAFIPKDASKLAFVTQTTLSVDDTAQIVSALQARFPLIAVPHKEDICYATTNRQDAVKALGSKADLLLVIGSKTSSNSLRLVDVGLRAGAKSAYLIDDSQGIDWNWFDGVSTLGLTAGASAPEDLVEGVLAACQARFNVTQQEVLVTREDVIFKLPRAVADPEIA